MKISKVELDRLLTGYFTGKLSDPERARIDDWRKESPENEKVYNENLSAWESISLLNEMEQFNSFEALKKINSKLSQPGPSSKWWHFIQRAAAILLLPLLIYSAYISFHKNDSAGETEREIMQKVTSRQGMVTQFTMNDGTKVWLNSGTELEFPMHFSGKKREVILKGEAFFEVSEDKKHPFCVRTNNLNIQVLGTSFNVESYEDDVLSEVVLVKGGVELSSETGGVLNEFGLMHPDQRVVYDKNKHKIVKKEDVEVYKYISWRDGYLIFRDDRMEEVIKNLNRWFNVEIIIKDEELKSYRFRATFKNENLMQVLNLLKLSSPIDYEVIQRKRLPDGEYTKLKVNIMRKSN